MKIFYAIDLLTFNTIDNPVLIFQKLVNGGLIRFTAARAFTPTGSVSQFTNQVVHIVTQVQKFREQEERDLHPTHRKWEW